MWREVLGGIRAEERLRLGELFAVIPYRPCREDDWGRAVALVWKLRAKDLTVPWLDVLIAGIAIHDGVRPYTVDTLFQKIARHTGLRLYPAGLRGRFQGRQSRVNQKSDTKW